MVKRVLFLLVLILGLGLFSFVCAKENSVQDGKNIRVAISTNDFSSIKYNEITLSATGDLRIYDCYDKKVIAQLKPNTPVKFVLRAGMFDIYIDDGSTLPITDMITGPLYLTTSSGAYLKVVGLNRLNKEAMYRGAIKLDKVKNKIDSFYVINELNLQQYLYSVVPNEMPVSFGLEALKAQAVAARNYALRPRGNAQNTQYDVCDSVNSQVYFGVNTEHSLSNKAVDETENIAALYDGNLILALYHSTSGGITENYEHAFNRPGTRIFPAKPLPYLKAVSDIPAIPQLNTEEEVINFYKATPQTYENNSSFFRWTKEWTNDELSQILNETIKSQLNSGFVAQMMPYSPDIGLIKEIKVLQRGKSGKIIKMTIATENNVFMVEKELVIRKIFRKGYAILPSANVVFEQIYDEEGNLSVIKAFGGGYGHGVGMSQYGAGYLSKHGKSFSDILHHYYTDIALGTVPVSLPVDTVQTVTQNFYTTDTNAVLKVENLQPNVNLKIKINSYGDIKLNMGKTPKKVLAYAISPYLKQGKNTISYQIFQPVNSTNSVKLYVEFIKGEVKSNE